MYMPLFLHRPEHHGRNPQKEPFSKHYLQLDNQKPNKIPADLLKLNNVSGAKAIEAAFVGHGMYLVSTVLIL